MTVGQARELLVIAGEKSGDEYGAALVRELRARNPALQVAGLGGPKMAAAGVQLLEDLASGMTMGFSGLVTTLRRLCRAYRHITHRLSSNPPDAIVLIDLPEFNLRIARHAKHVGVPVIYYVSPQVWAWRRGRIRKIAERVQKMLCLFDFEKELYQRAGVDVTHVGHPLLDALADKLDGVDRLALRRSLGLRPAGQVIGLLPGSRSNEIRHVFPVLLRAAEIIQRQMKNVQFVVAQAEGVDGASLGRTAERHHVEFQTVTGRTHDVMLASDLLLVCSGTATLEAGLLGTPMVVTYQTDLLSYLFLAPLIAPGRYALPNIVAGRELVPEFYLFDARAEKVAAAALEMLNGRLDDVRRELKVIRQKLGRPGATARAAEEILKII